MLDGTVYKLINEVKVGLQQVINFVNNFQQAVRLDSTGKEIRLLAIQRLLIEKNTFTEAELTAKSGDIIKEMQKQAEDAAKEAAEAAAKTTVVPATPEQTAAVTNAPTTDAAVKEAVAQPPQA